MANVYILAIDLAKRGFQVCATDPGGACVDAPDLYRTYRLDRDAIVDAAAELFLGN